jgi:hypothetical protein
VDSDDLDPDAQVRALFAAATALSAGSGQRDDDACLRRRGQRSSDFVAERDRQHRGPSGTVDEVEVRAADASGVDSYDDLVVTGRGFRHFIEAKIPGSMKANGAHGRQK